MNNIWKRLATIFALGVSLAACAEDPAIGNDSEPGDRFWVSEDLSSGVVDVYVVVDRDSGCHYLLTDPTDVPLVERKWPSGRQVCREDHKR